MDYSIIRNFSIWGTSLLLYVLACISETLAIYCVNVLFLLCHWHIANFNTFLELIFIVCINYHLIE